MDPNNNQTVNPQVPNAAAQAPQTPPSQTPPAADSSQTSSQIPKTVNKRLLYAVLLLGLLALVLIGVAAFYIQSSPKESKNNVAVSPTPIQSVSTQEEVEVAEVSGVSDLDNLIIGLAEADVTLEQELTKLEKDSNF